MSEPREECYECLNNQSCIPGADYGSIYCSIYRKYKMPEHREDRVYATKFAVMQKQIDEKEERIKELKSKLEEENRTIKKFTSAIFNGNIEKEFIPVEKVNNEIEKYEYMLAETIHGEIQKYTPGEILLKIDTLKEILEDK